MTQLLSEDEVQSIFRYIYGEESECKLDFKIIDSKADVISVGTPTCELKEGIYLVCNTQREDFPSHLRDVVVMKPPCSEGNACVWNSTGPRTTKSFDLNRRPLISYTDTNKTVLGSKCGCIWTKVENGVDNKQFRILHVRLKLDRAHRSNEEEEDNGCRKCGRNDKKHLQLQCSGCLIVFEHMKCAGLSAIPEGEWFCSGECERAGAASDSEEEGEPEDTDCEPVQETESPGPTTTQEQAASARASQSSNHGSDGMSIKAPMVHGHNGLSMAFNEESTNPSSPQSYRAQQTVSFQSQPPTTFGSISAGVPTMPRASQQVLDTPGMFNAMEYATMPSQHQQQAHQVQQAPGMFPMGMAMPWNNLLSFPYLLPPQQTQQYLAPVNTEPPQLISIDNDRKRSAGGSTGNVPSNRAVRARNGRQPRPDKHESQYAHQFDARRREEGTKDAPFDIDKPVVVKREETEDTPAFYSLSCRLDTSEDWEALGFITAKSHATLTDLRNTIQSLFVEQLGDDWIFVLDPLGPVKLIQEVTPAEQIMTKGTGTRKDPFLLGIVVIQE